MSDNPNEALSYEEVEEKEEKETEKQTSKSKSSYVSLDASAGFKDMLLKPAIMKAITDCGFEHPSEVQQQCIPQAIYGTDILCQAKSGMGKTAVFSLSALQLIDEDLAEIQVLVLCHTRELAFQVHREFERFSKYMRDKIKLAVFYGGHPIADHIKILNEPKKPQILVGTPGRINQLIRDGHLKLNKLKIFVLDECDNMLEKLDMRGDVQSIFKATPKNKQVMMFTATLPEEIRQVCRKFMNSPVEILVDNESKLTLHGLKQYYSQVEEQGKTKKLIDLLDKLEFHQVVIFVNKVDRAEILNSVLTKSNFPSICIHSSLTQPERISRYEKFKNFEKRVMVATDLFGRGIDIERVNIVFNYDMSDSPDQYLHRVGRAGRFGTKGLAISFVTSKDAEILEKIQAKFEVQISPLPNEIDVSTYM